MSFQPVPSKVKLPELEKAILEQWRRGRIFERSVEERRGRPVFTLYEGPPTANGSPGIHHVLARVFKDIIPRYWTMKGYYAPRKGGWDTHGLPVELEVERDLGISSKREIEAYGIAAFNARCRDSVFRYVKEWVAMTERIGFWIDMDDAYATMDNGYVESCWWIIKQLWDKGLVYQGHKVTPHCPRCGTSLSSHEVALGYREDTDDPSLYIKFELDAEANRDHPLGRLLADGVPTYLLAWTTTPWTLPGNTALAVAAAEDYAVVETAARNGRPERLILATALVGPALRGAGRVLQQRLGIELIGLRYRPLYDPYRAGIDVLRFEASAGASVLVARPQPAGERLTHPVIGGDFVAMDEGTGIVHMAPAFGEVDFVAGQEDDLLFIQPVDLRGNVTFSLPELPVKDRFVKDADPLILGELDGRGLLWRSERIRHTYPFCWRCDTSLLYYAKTSWYIQTTARKEALLAGNDEINWYPRHIQQGRFGDWLRNNVDWALSRERYWGTPLPMWRCRGCGATECIGGLDELRAKPDVTMPDGAIDLHRPFVDGISYRCSRCGDAMQRLPEVIDCWFDSGAMPVAQWHYPFENRELFERHFPADYICEAVDQTRGWFYSLHAISTLLFDQPSYRNVICLGLILDRQGEKMSKSRGNVVDPWQVLDEHGADALRWYLYTASPPGNPRRFSSDLVGEAARRFLLTLWNTYSFFVTYANIDGFDPKGRHGDPQPSDLDRWVTSHLHKLIADVDSALAHYDPTTAGRRIEEFVDLLSNWYVRRSRRRFWKSENDADKLAAYCTLYDCLATLARLLAPFTPFVAEAMYQNLVRSADATAPDSVHLDAFPEADDSKIDEGLMADTALVMRIASLGRAARSKAALKVRQPVARLLIGVRGSDEAAALERLRSQVLDELNAKDMALLAAEDEVFDYTVRPNLPLLGPRLGGALAAVTAALRALDPAAVATAVAGGQSLELAGQVIAPDELLVERKEKAGYAAANEAGYTVAVATAITPELRAEGLARELVHRLQTMRRSAGFDIADRIITYYVGPTAVGDVFAAFGDYIRGETLSLQTVAGEPPADAYVERQRVDGHDVMLAVRRA